MPQNEDRLIIQIDTEINESSVKKNIKRLEEEHKKLQKTLNKQLKTSGQHGAGVDAGALQKTRKALALNNMELNKERKLLSQIDMLQVKQTANISNASIANRKYTWSTQKNTKHLQDQEKSMKNITKEMGKQKRLRARTSTAKGTGTTNGKEGFLGTMLGGGGTSFGHKVATTAQYATAGSGIYLVASAFSAAAEAALEFNHSIRVTAAVLNATIEQSTMLAKDLEGLSVAFGGSISEINQAAIALGRAGLAFEDIAAGTEVVMKMAMLTGDSIADATSAISSYRQVFRDSGTSILEFGDQLAYAANQSRLSTQDIGTLSNYALAASKSIGLTSEQVLGLSTAFSNFGLNASTIGTQIRKFAESIKTQTDASANFYAVLGINQAQLLTDMQRDSTATMESLVKSISELSTSEYNAAVSKLPLLQKNVFDTIRKTGDKIIQHTRALYKSEHDSLAQAETIALSYKSALERTRNALLELTNEAINSSLDSMFDLDNQDKFNEQLEQFQTIAKASGTILVTAGKALTAYLLVVKTAPFLFRRASAALLLFNTSLLGSRGAANAALLSVRKFSIALPAVVAGVAPWAAGLLAVAGAYELINEQSKATTIRLGEQALALRDKDTEGREKTEDTSKLQAQLEARKKQQQSYIDILNKFGDTANVYSVHSGNIIGVQKEIDILIAKMAKLQKISRSGISGGSAGLSRLVVTDDEIKQMQAWYKEYQNILKLEGSVRGLNNNIIGSRTSMMGTIGDALQRNSGLIKFHTKGNDEYTSSIWDSNKAFENSLILNSKLVTATRNLADERAAYGEGNDFEQTVKGKAAIDEINSLKHILSLLDKTVKLKTLSGNITAISDKDTAKLLLKRSELSETDARINLGTTTPLQLHRMQLNAIQLQLGHVNEIEASKMRQLTIQELELRKTKENVKYSEYIADLVQQNATAKYDYGKMVNPFYDYANSAEYKALQVQIEALNTAGKDSSGLQLQVDIESFKSSAFAGITGEEFTSQITSTFTTGIQDALNGELDFDSLVSGLASSLGGTALSAGLTGGISNLGADKAFGAGNIASMGVGIGLSALGELFSDDSKTAAERHQEFVDKIDIQTAEIVSALDEQTKLLGAFGDNLAALQTSALEKPQAEFEAEVRKQSDLHTSGSLVQLNNVELGLDIKDAIDDGTITEMDFDLATITGLEEQYSSIASIATGFEDLLKFEKITEEFKTSTIVYANALLEVNSVYKDLSDSLKDVYDSVNDGYYANLELVKAQEEVNALIGDKTFNEYLEGVITGLDDFGTNIESLREDLTNEGESEEDFYTRLNAIAELERATGASFDNSTAAALDYLDSIELVGEAIVEQQEIYLDLASTLEDTLDSIEDIIDRLRDINKTPEEQLQSFDSMMVDLMGMDMGADPEAYSEALEKTIEAAEVLFDTNNFIAGRDQEYARLIAANDFEALENITLTEIDLLKIIADNTAETATNVGGTGTSSVASIVGNARPQTGYASGGYTGDYGTNDVAGVVHGQEYVVNAKTTKDLGLNESGGVFKAMLKELAMMNQELSMMKQMQVKTTADTKRQLDTQRATLDELITLNEGA